MEEKTIFVADANFFIQGSPCLQVPNTIYTTNGIIEEIKDRRSRERLEEIKLSHQVIIKEPSKESYDRILKCSTDSGNVTLLSDNDMKLLALALDFSPKTEEVAEEEEETMFDQWISAATYGRTEDLSSVLCTDDTTMQCVAQIMGIKVISPTGQRITEIKRWLLRCSACGAETLDANKEFCPECGHHTLIRYALVMRGGVEKELPLPKRFQPSSRGQRYSIPVYRGGKSPRMVLSEDELMEERRKYIWAHGKKHLTEESGTFFEPRKKRKGPPVYGYGKINPNVPHRKGKK